VLISFIIRRLLLLLSNQMLKQFNDDIRIKKMSVFILQQFEIHIRFVNVVKLVPLLIVFVQNFEFQVHNIEFFDELDLIRQESRQK
jgi:hypothetical protein